MKLLKRVLNFVSGDLEARLEKAEKALIAARPILEWAEKQHNCREYYEEGKDDVDCMDLNDFQEAVENWLASTSEKWNRRYLQFQEEQQEFQAYQIKLIFDKDNAQHDRDKYKASLKCAIEFLIDARGWIGCSAETLSSLHAVNILNERIGMFLDRVKECV